MTTDVNEVVTPPNGQWSLSFIAKMIEDGRMEAVTFIPEETVPIRWNGVTVYVTKGQEIEVPKVHYELYRDSRKATVEAFQNARKTLEKRSFGPGQTSVEAGWNGNAPRD